ncbi:hypothetical protein OZ911_11945 [Pseudomonas fortuita]|uniref:Uncharacterized protein n=1 Tax=Pseudomonas fortuita TaxID=3233375 RepID=A0ACD4PFS8_9PSED|nr:hypothetical protein [Pseudomonas putida]WAP66061.1 hypothetical protein OZ911_11945 [Pseudomonas putida]
MKNNLFAMLLLTASFSLLGGCFDRDSDHPAKDADPSKPSLQMQQPSDPVINPPAETKAQNQ